MKRSKPERSIEERVEWALGWLKERATPEVIDGMARHDLPSDKAMGVAMKDIKKLGGILGRNHELALALWATGSYEARLLTSFVGDPAVITATQMDAWNDDFDNWAFCDTLSFNLFDRSPHAWKMVEKWSKQKGEFQKRTAFALLWSLALHDIRAKEQQFIDSLALIEHAAGDDRSSVKKAVSMALRAIGKRNAVLKSAAREVAARLAASKEPSARWIGKDAGKAFA